MPILITAVLDEVQREELALTAQRRKEKEQVPPYGGGGGGGVVGHGAAREWGGLRLGIIFDMIKHVEKRKINAAVDGWLVVATLRRWKKPGFGKSIHWTW